MSILTFGLLSAPLSFKHEEPEGMQFEVSLLFSHKLKRIRMNNYNFCL